MLDVKQQVSQTRGWGAVSTINRNNKRRGHREDTALRETWGGGDRKTALVRSGGESGSHPPPPSLQTCCCRLLPTTPQSCQTRVHRSVHRCASVSSSCPQPVRGGAVPGPVLVSASSSSFCLSVEAAAAAWQQLTASQQHRRLDAAERFGSVPSPEPGRGSGLLQTSAASSPLQGRSCCCLLWTNEISCCARTHNLP